ncbi:MAG: UbiD family decarboxylase [Chloroflexota bacterium]
MAYRDLREWINRLEKEGELASVKTQVDWNLEIGGIIQEVYNQRGPALLFENIKGYQNTPCRKLLANATGSYRRIAMMMGLPGDTPPQELIRVFMRRTKKPVKPVMVKEAPVKENVVKGDAVNLLDFPTPKWHSRDGNRYIGTLHGVVTKDPETGWENVGTYRSMIQDRSHTGMSVLHGQHIWHHWRKHKKMGRKTMPTAVVIGWDPVLPMIAASGIPLGVDEYDVMGALREEPVELVRCETSDLRVPATAEIVLEGEINLDIASLREEGPFGEYTGYYGSGKPGLAPVFTVNCVTYRNDPIFQGTLIAPPPDEHHWMEAVNHSANVWDELNKHMVGVTGVNVDPSTGWANVFVQIDNSYIGQVQQVAAAIWASGISTMVGKNIMVVDTDIDIFDLGKLNWAFAYRVDPKRDLIPYPGWVSPLDPVIHPKDRVPRADVQMGTRLLIDATKKLTNPRTDQWFGERFAPTCYPDEETTRLVKSRWQEYGITSSNECRRSG